MQNLNLIRLPDIGKHFRVMARAFGSSFIAVKPACRLMAIISSLSRSEGYTMVHYTHWNLSRRATASGILALTLWATLPRSEEHTSELQSLMRISYAVFCLKKKQLQHRKLI